MRFCSTSGRYMPVPQIEPSTELVQLAAKADPPGLEAQMASVTRSKGLVSARPLGDDLERRVTEYLSQDDLVSCRLVSKTFKQWVNPRVVFVQPQPRMPCLRAPSAPWGEHAPGKRVSALWGRGQLPAPGDDTVCFLPGFSPSSRSSRSDWSEVRRVLINSDPRTLEDSWAWIRASIEHLDFGPRWDGTITNGEVFRRVKTIAFGESQRKAIFCPDISRGEALPEPFPALEEVEFRNPTAAALSAWQWPSRLRRVSMPWALYQGLKSTGGLPPAGVEIELTQGPLPMPGIKRVVSLGEDSYEVAQRSQLFLQNGLAVLARLPGDSDMNGPLHLFTFTPAEFCRHVDDGRMMGLRLELGKTETRLQELAGGRGVVFFLERGVLSPAPSRSWFKCIPRESLTHLDGSVYQTYELFPFCMVGASLLEFFAVSWLFSWPNEPCHGWTPAVVTAAGLFASLFGSRWGMNPRPSLHGVSYYGGFVGCVLGLTLFAVGFLSGVVPLRRLEPGSRVCVFDLPPPPKGAQLEDILAWPVWVVRNLVFVGTFLGAVFRSRVDHVLNPRVELEEQLDRMRQNDVGAPASRGNDELV